MNKVYSPVFVTGIERSGSSIIAKILQLCGAFTGQVSAMQENIQIKEWVDRYYTLMGADLKGQYPLPNTKEILIPTNWNSKITAGILPNENYIVGKPWMYKESRLCQIWPVWNYAFPNAKWIIVRRRSGDIIQSCLKTGYMTAFNDETTREAINVASIQDGWKYWIRQHEKLFVEMIETGLNCKQVWPERMVTGDYGQIYEMLDWIGLEWNEDIVKVVEPLLWSSRQKERSK